MAKIVFLSRHLNPHPVKKGPKPSPGSHPVEISEDNAKSSCYTLYSRASHETTFPDNPH